MTMKEETIQELQEKIQELQEENEQIQQDLNILWELYGSDNTTDNEKINAAAVTVSLAVLLIISIIALIIGLRITGGI